LKKITSLEDIILRVENRDLRIETQLKKEVSNLSMKWSLISILYKLNRPLCEK